MNKIPEDMSDKQFQHIGIAVLIDDTYLIVMVDKPKKEILGHYTLTFGQK